MKVLTVRPVETIRVEMSAQEAYALYYCLDMVVLPPSRSDKTIRELREKFPPLTALFDALYEAGPSESYDDLVREDDRP